VKKLQHILIAAVAGGAFAGLAHAQASGHDGHHAAAPAASKTANAGMSEGEVRKIDKENRKITLKHGPIKNLEMSAMTMAFIAADASLLEKVKVGDKVRFVAASKGGRFTVTEIQPAP
jgi:Cu(I)/Ag(I) efflux system periplasmic protein CusF